jgi:hypothetical protein
MRRAVSACADGSIFERLHYLWRAWRAVRLIAPSGSFDAEWYARDGSVRGGWPNSDTAISGIPA